jgi:hypothetical protein
MRIRIQILASTKGSNLLKSDLKNRLIFHAFWLDICKLMRIRIRFLIQIINFDADPYADPDYYLMLELIRVRIQVSKMMLHNTADSYTSNWRAAHG